MYRTLALPLLTLLLAAPLHAFSHERPHDCAPSGKTRWISAPQKYNGSGVDTRYRLGGTPALGQLLPISVELSRITAPAGAKVKYSTTPGLQLVSTPDLLPLSLDALTIHALKVIPQAEGLHYVHVFTEQEGKSSVIAIPVQVGKATNLPSQGQLKTTPSGDKVISMPARENP